ncbi:MAG: hypothetical protein F6K65_05720 [Moorea sp. SIO3C2]|nr:hypothetical protein [Moorena sp. SIO3C2]
MGETTAVRSWGEPPRPHCLPKTALHRLAKGAGNREQGAGSSEKRPYL